MNWLYTALYLLVAPWLVLAAELGIGDSDDEIPGPSAG